jgi:WD40 repeat protein
MPSTGGYFINIRHQLFGADDGSDFVLRDLLSGQERLRLRGDNGFFGMAISPDGSRLLLAKASITLVESELSLWSMKSGRRLLAFNRQGFIRAMSFSPDGNWLLAVFSQITSTNTDKPIQIWDATPLPEKP